MRMLSKGPLRSKKMTLMRSRIPKVGFHARGGVGSSSVKRGLKRR